MICPYNILLSCLLVTTPFHKGLFTTAGEEEVQVDPVVMHIATTQLLMPPLGNLKFQQSPLTSSRSSKRYAPKYIKRGRTNDFYLNIAPSFEDC